jgi:acyl transferase domain-containing protein/acyl carrier protein
MSMSPSELTRWLVGRISELTGIPAGDIDVDLPLRDLSIGSAAVAELAAELTDVVGIDVHPAMAFEYPTIRALANALEGAAPPPVVGARAAGGSEGLAIVGMSVRVPGAESPAELWQLLEQGRDPIGKVPADRWQLDPGSLTDAERGARFAGLLTDIASFDAAFFRIPREEAVRMDPQQRLLLQGAWEAMEDAGQVPDRLAGSPAGVYVGISTNDYARRQVGVADEVHALTLTGNALSVAANRLSYQFDLRGPSLAVDTACSSSLVAVHLAVRDLRSGSCDLAIVAGVNLLIEPDASIALARAGMLAPDGRCKAFDVAANGYVRAEGCVVVVLKPLQHALADRDRIYAVILGSQVTSDGRTNGLTAPNPAAQEAVLRAAYADAQADPRAVQYVECHGTGTLLGDPIEARALGAVVGDGRPPGQRCLIGSVKSNLGHLESAAGLAGLVKAALSLHHGRVPGTLHFSTANPYIDFAGLGLRVADTACDWPGPADGRLAGVSSFGFGGTNAHVVLASGPAPASAQSPAGQGDDPRPVVLPVSARHPESLAAAAHALADRLEELAKTGEVDLPRVAAATSVRRAHHQFRRAVVGATADDLAAQLREIRPDQVAAYRPDRRVVFAFPGQTGHAASALLAFAKANPLAAATLRRCGEIIETEAGWNLLDVLRGPDADRILREDTQLAQPAAVAAQLGLAAAWQGAGVRPAEVIGHSLGEVSAAAVAGALSVDQAIRVAIARGRVISEVIGTGAMLAMAISEPDAAEIAARSGQKVAIATVNGPEAIVLSGAKDALEEIRLRAEADGVLARWVPVDYPSHSPWMSGAAAELEAALSGLDAASPALRFWSATDGGPVGGALDERYWGRNLRSPVRFAAAAAALLADGPVAVIELGTHPVLRTPFAQLASQAEGADVAFVATMERGADPVLHSLTGLARLYDLGADPRWDLLVPGTDYLPVPTYPWRRERHWLPRPRGRQARARGAHPLLGSKLDLAFPAGRHQNYWELDLTGEPPSVTAGHVVGGRVVLPAAGYLEMALAAGRQLGISGPIEVRDARFTAMLPLAEGPVTVQTIAESRGDDGFDVTVMSRRPEGDWLVNATATVAPASGPVAPPPVPDPATARATCFHPIAEQVFYDALGAVGLDYAGGYQGLSDIWYGAGTAVARLRDAPEPAAFVIDPPTLDAALQLLAAAGRGAPEGRPVIQGVRRFVVAGPARDDLIVVARGDEPGDRRGAGAVAVFAGLAPVVTVEGVHVADLTGTAATPRSALHWYEPAWRRQDSRAPQRGLDESAWAVVTSGASDVAGDIAARLRAAGAQVRRAGPGQRDWRSLLRDLAGSRGRAVDVVYVAAQPARPDARQIDEEVIALAGLIKAASIGEAELHRLWVVTSGSQDVAEAGQSVSRPGSGALWGLVRVLPFENPNLRVYCVDVDATPDRQSVDGLMAEFAAPSPETEVTWRDGQRYVARIVPVAAPAPALGASVVRADASYLISGGLGAIGLRVACWLAGQGARSLALISRTPPGQDAQRLIGELEQAGARVLVITGDVAEPGTTVKAAAALRQIAPIGGVVHAAGVLQDGPLLEMPDAAIEAVLRPKVSGALMLDAALSGDRPDWVIYFSSAASVLGSPGQANYCAANAFLDSYAATRRSEGQSALVINWGAWADAGLGAGVAGAQGRLAAAYAALGPEEGIAALAALVAAGRPRTMVLASDLRHLIRLFPAAAGTARFSELASAKDVLRHDIGLGSPSDAARPTLKQPYAAPRNEFERRVCGIWQRSLGFHRIGVFDGFFELGGDSVFANQMLLEVNRTLGVSITAAEAFEDLTVARLIELAERDMLEQLESMSDEEAERLLHAKGEA